MKHALAVMAVLCLFGGGVRSQKAPLRIGDTVPALVLAPLSATGESQPISLRGKPTLLDFWATWCTSCLKHFPQLEALQKQYAGSVQVLLVNTAATGDTEKKVAAFRAKHKTPGSGAFSLPTLVGDTVLDRLFPHKLVPHYVWISASGVVQAITGAEALTNANMAAFMAGAPLAVVLKSDAPPFNAALPLLSNTGGKGLLCQSAFTAFQPGWGSGYRPYGDSAGEKHTWLNVSILALYRFAHRYATNRLVLEAADSSRFFHDCCSPESWTSNLYCYELLVPLHTSLPALQARMAADLDRFFGLRGRTEKRSRPCWVVIAKGAPRASPSVLPGGRSRSLEAWMTFFNSSVVGYVPGPVIIDETGWPPAHVLTLPSGAAPSDIPALRKALEQEGLTIIPASRTLDVFVLGDVPAALPFQKQTTKSNN